MGHSRYNFKSSGVRTSDRRFTRRAPNVDRPIGIKTPLEIGDDFLKRTQAR